MYLEYSTDTLLTYTSNILIITVLTITVDGIVQSRITNKARKKLSEFDVANATPMDTENFYKLYTKIERRLKLQMLKAKYQMLFSVALFVVSLIRIFT